MAWDSTKSNAVDPSDPTSSEQQTADEYNNMVSYIKAVIPESGVLAGNGSVVTGLTASQVGLGEGDDVTFNSVTSSGLTVSGNVLVNGSVDGRDVSADGGKLDGIESGAEVNNISDVNAGSLTGAGDTTLHFHNADRDRAVHTGSQASSTVYDFNDTVAVNGSVASNTTHRGLTNNPHAVTAGQVSLGVTDNATFASVNVSGGTVSGDFAVTGSVDGRDVSADGGKLDGIEAGAEVNNLSDVQAGSLTSTNNTVLHFHDSDRDRSNHTGSQAVSTVYDFDDEVATNGSVASNTSHRGSDGSDHSFINQSVTSSASPTFNVLSVSGVNVSGNVGVTGSVVADAYWGDGSNLTGISAGGVSQFDCTVGSIGADYTTIGSAIDDGNTRLLLIADTNETANLAVPNNLYIRGYGIDKTTIYTGSYSFISGVDLKIEDCTVVFSNQVTNCMNNISSFKFDRVKFDNNTNKYIIFSSSDIVGQMNGCEVHFPDEASTGFLFQNKEVLINDLKLYGGGRNCRGILVHRGVINNLYVSGTFDGSNTSITCNDGAQLNNVYDNSSGCNFLITSGTMNNYFAGNSLPQNSIQVRNGGKLCNSTLSSSKSSLTIGSAAYVSNVHVAGSVTVNGNFAKLSNFTSNGPIVSTGNYGTYNNLRVGAVAGGGALTINLQAGASGNVISNVHTDADIIDSGTVNQVLGSFTY